MTKRQVEKLADLTGQLAVAAVIGSVGDAVISGQRILADLVGFLVGVLLILAALHLTGRLGGDKL